MSSIKCNNCNKELEKDTVFCTGCGLKVDLSAQKTQTVKSNKSKTPIIIAIVVILFAGLGYTVTTLFSSDTSSEQMKNEDTSKDDDLDDELFDNDDEIDDETKDDELDDEVSDDEVADDEISDDYVADNLDDEPLTDDFSDKNDGFSETFLDNDNDFDLQPDDFENTSPSQDAENFEQSQPTTSTTTDYAQYFLPHSNTEYLVREDLEQLSADFLRFARNEIFARHGHSFDSADLQAHFSSTSWYENKNIKVGYTLLNAFEIANIELIQAVENTK